MSPEQQRADTRWAELEQLRRAHRGFVWPVTAGFAGFYLLTVCLAAYAPGWMARPAIGEVTIGVLLVLANFAVTLVVTLGYRSYSNRRLDALARTAAQVAGTNEERER